MSYNLTEEEFLSRLEVSGSTILFKRVPSDTITPVLAYLKISQQFKNNNFLFESSEKGNSKGRFSALGFMPDLVWKSCGKESFINKNFEKDPKNFLKENGDVLENLRNLINHSRTDLSLLSYGSEELPGICSGIFGYIGYDMIRLIENIPDMNLKDEIGIPDSIFIRPQVVVVFDNLFDCALICTQAFSPQSRIPDLIEDAKLSKKIKSIVDMRIYSARSDSTRRKFDCKSNLIKHGLKLNEYERAVERIMLAEKILAEPYENDNLKTKAEFNFSSNCSEHEYCEIVERAKRYITNGDIFQVLPSQRFTSDFNPNLDEFSFYRALRSINPSPFLFYLKFDDFILTGSSPEIMVSVKNKKVTVRPLAGTRKRGKNLQEDKKIADELLSDEKEVAEHLMLIDLGRHDVGSVSIPGSVKLTEKMIIENYSHVMHISSNVEGILRDELEAIDALIAGFPAGTVSGAPKIRAMEIIEELEKVKRSFYAGCVGYFASNGDMETCITLRSALIKNGKIYLQSGAGVVFDSDPKSEYQECQNKVRALIKACEKIGEF